MTPAEQAKAEGLKSLSVVAEMTGQSLQTLGNWAKHKPELFRVVLTGCDSITHKQLMIDMAKYYWFLRDYNCINVDADSDEHGLAEAYLYAADQTCAEIRSLAQDA
jgi:hypothetical protein